MSVNGLSNADFNYSLLTAGNKGIPSNPGGVNQADTSSASGIAANFALYLANFRTQTLGSLLSTASGADTASASTSLGALLGSQNAATDPLAAPTTGGGVNGLSAAGRNTALFDPESAYKMMSFINNEDVAFKAEFSELSQMKAYVAEMQQDGQTLGGIGTSTGNDSIKTQLQEFVSQYNAWVQRFDADMQSGGVLADTRAAQVSRYELDQSVENIFYGAADGLNGLRDLGLTIDAGTKLATLDTAKLDSVLAGNKQGAVDTLQQFSTSFAKSAELLDSNGNFIPNRLDNLGRAIHYIDDNKSSLQAEFGLGDAAKPSGQVAQALAAYNKVSGI